MRVTRPHHELDSSERGAPCLSVEEQRAARDRRATSISIRDRSPVAALPLNFAGPLVDSAHR